MFLISGNKEKYQNFSVKKKKYKQKKKTKTKKTTTKNTHTHTKKKKNERKPTSSFKMRQWNGDLTHFRLNRLLPHTIYWKSPISILGMLGDKI